MGDKKNWAMRTLSLEVAFEEYHWDEWELGLMQKFIRPRLVWSFQDGTAYSRLGEDFALQAYDVKMDHEGVRDIVPEPKDGFNENIRIWSFANGVDRLCAEDQWTAFIEFIRGEVAGVSGDDTYFDYFPDLFFVADQVALSLDEAMETDFYTMAVKVARQDAYNRKYWDLEPEVIYNAENILEQLEEAKEVRDRAMRRGLLKEVDGRIEMVDVEEYRRLVNEKGLKDEG